MAFSPTPLDSQDDLLRSPPTPTRVSVPRNGSSSKDFLKVSAPG